MEWAEGPVRVRVPATSANLGPGFDTLGLALGLHDVVEARVAPEDVLPLASVLEGHPDNVAPCLFGGLTIAWVGTGAAGLPEARAIKLDPLPEVLPVAFIAPAPVRSE